nr:ribonuclease H-like domain-containing protein [Tanacetum cinerariifolium]
MTDYSLWEVILNGDSSTPIRVVDGVVQAIAPTTVELQKLISQLKILGESLSQEDINMKFLRSLPSEWRTHTLIWRNKDDLGDQSLDDLFNNLKIYEAEGNPQQDLKDKGVIDSGFLRHMAGNISYLSDFKELNEGYVEFGGNSKGGKITGKGKIKTGKLDFNDVYFVKELKFNLFSVS